MSNEISNEIIDKQALFSSLPPEWCEDLSIEIREQVAKTKTKVVILDDDPTGTQTVHDIPVLTTWGIEELKSELIGSKPAFFILTNSRGLVTEEAISLSAQIAENLKVASEETGVKISIISRSDSTLRGHFPGEVDEMARVMKDSSLPYLICPYFLEGGRFTINDTHYVEEKGTLIPAAMTPFANDASFGFNHSDLKKWVEEKTNGAVAYNQVYSVSIDDIRLGGPEKVAAVLGSVPDSSACIINAVSYRDMEVVVAGLLKAQSKGKRFLYRTAASYVRVRVGISSAKGLLPREKLASDHPTGGLFIVGSYVPKTTAQINALLENTDILPVKISVDHLLDPDKKKDTLTKNIAKMNSALNQGLDTLVYTSRKLVKGDDPDASLKIGQIVSDCLVKIVKALEHEPRYLVAKGGITSSDVATLGLNVKRAIVSGQALPGVPVWKLGDESKYPGMSYVIFPGNVGEDNALAKIKLKLES
jgi:uncharacterized protein YgbK (DUF1537 family)